MPLASRVAAELELLLQGSAYKRDDDLVFAHPEAGKPIDRSKLLKRFKAALRRADVRVVRFHDLRHTFGTRMAAQGVPMRVLQEMMGRCGARARVAVLVSAGVFGALDLDLQAASALPSVRLKVVEAVERRESSADGKAGGCEVTLGLRQPCGQLEQSWTRSQLTWWL